MDTKTMNEEERDQLVSSLVEVGLGWARYGLTVGRLALRTSARTMDKAAETLDTLTSTLETQPEDEAAAPAGPEVDGKVEIATRGEAAEA